MIFYHNITTPFDDRDFAKALKNKREPLAQLPEQMTLNQGVEDSVPLGSPI
tara:strand:+ start:240 stop:392 length:153 start_codon:yes stop_codon:yes gene_type:complete